MQKAFVLEKEENKEKVKVTSLEIIVTGTKEKPYFEIKYKEVGEEHYHIGYSSYDLNNVFEWKEECFEIVNQVAEEYKSNDGWIPCEERLPSKEEYQKCNGQFIVSDGNRTYATYFDIYDTLRFGEPTIEKFRIDKCVIAWQPLPQPYVKGE